MDPQSIVNLNLSRKNYHYSFKIFPRFLLVKTACIIHRNQLLLTKFGKKLCHIEPTTSNILSC